MNRTSAYAFRTSMGDKLSDFFQTKVLGGLNSIFVAVDVSLDGMTEKVFAMFLKVSFYFKY